MLLSFIGFLALLDNNQTMIFHFVTWKNHLNMICFVSPSLSICVCVCIIYVKIPLIWNTLRFLPIAICYYFLSYVEDAKDNWLSNKPMDNMAPEHNISEEERG